MSKVISIDIRERIIEHVNSGHSARSAARRFEVSPSFAVKLVKRWHEEGDIRPKYRGRQPGTGKLSPHRALICRMVDVTPDITLPELSDQLFSRVGLKVHPTALSGFLRRLGYSYKKNSGGHGTWTRGCEA